jgi:hypothetical protein
MTRRLIPPFLLACCPLALVWLAVTATPQRAASATPQGPAAAVGLSLFFQNGTMAPITLVGAAPRYIQEVDIVATTPPSTTDAGITPLIQNSEFSFLDWSGVTAVEEDWRPSVDGTTFTRQRFYGGAKWMENNSQFLVFPTDDNGQQVGDPLIAFAGSDNTWGPDDDGFVRRFVARQIATGCPAVGDTTGATFTAQGLVQLRDALKADQRARFVPFTATHLALRWTADNQTQRAVAISHADPAAFSFGYGFQVSLAEVSMPANGSYYSPGETVSFRVTYRDGQGNRLHPLGSLPTYGQFLRGEVPSGLRYHDFSLSPTLYYALKHRESNMERALFGPIDRLRTPRTLVTLDQFVLPQVAAATVATDGFSAAAQEVPAVSILLGGLFDPTIWDTPVSDTITFTIPNDALPGTYIAAIKARREFGGEARNRATTAEVPVGRAMPTIFTAKTGNCQTCHAGPSDFGNILHGGTDRRSCFGCHGPLFFEPDAALDIRVHEVHDRSDRFRSAGGNMRDCNLCHLTPPPGPARGLLNP